MRITSCLVTVLCTSVILHTAARGADDKPKIDPKADAVLKKMGKTLAGLKQFSVESLTIYDEVLPSGQKLQFTNRTRAGVVSPNRLRAQTEGDLRSREVAYDGKSITIYDRKRKVAATSEAPDNLDKLFDHLNKKYALTVPLADLLFSDAYKALTENVQIGGYVGLHQVDGIKCHHLAFRQDFIDWQMWVQDGEQALPRKIVITYKQLPSQPQHATVIKKWDLNAKFGADAFTLKLPNGVKKVSLDRLFAPEKKDD